MSKILSSGVRVKCLPNRYFRDRASGRLYVGESGTGKSKRPGSPPFYVSTERWRRDEGLPVSHRLFQRVGDEPASSDAQQPEG